MTQYLACRNILVESVFTARRGDSLSGFEELLLQSNPAAFRRAPLSIVGIDVSDYIQNTHTCTDDYCNQSDKDHGMTTPAREPRISWSHIIGPITLSVILFFA